MTDKQKAINENPLPIVQKLVATVSADPDVTQQTLDDVKAGIPARDAEIEALRKEIETLRAAQAQPSSDRAMLLKLMAAFDMEVWNCPNCTAAEETKDCDSAIMLREYLSNNPVIAQQPVSGADGVGVAVKDSLTSDERAAFEWWASDEGESPKAVERVGHGYSLAQIQGYWVAWQARAALAQQEAK